MSRRAISGCLPIHPPTTTHNDLIIKTRGKRRFIGKSDRLVEAEKKLEAYLSPYRPEVPLSGAWRLEVTWVFQQNTRHKAGEPHTVKPDMSNLLKTFEDALTRVNIIEDDARICWQSLVKSWGETPGIFFNVEEIGDDKRSE